MLVYPPIEDPKPQLITMLQLRLLKKLGQNAYPFTFTVSTVFLLSKHSSLLLNDLIIDST